MNGVNTIVSLCLVVACIVVSWLRTRKGRLPPGPTGLPLLGNTLQVPQQHAWRQYLKWIKEYGSIFSLNIAGSTIIIIGSAQVAQDILNRRSATTSNRPRMVMANELVTKGMHPLLRQYDASCVLHQRMQAPVLSVRSANSYAKLMELKSLELLNRMTEDGPESDFSQHIATCNLGIVYGLIYGHDIKTGNEPFVVACRKTQADFGRVSTPGAYIVDTLPFLNYLPAALAPWKTEARRLYAEESALHLQNLDYGLQSPGWNFAKEFSRSSESERSSRLELAYDLGIMLNAGFDTTTMQLEWFLVACINYPHCLSKAQAELEKVVGRERPPLMGDKEHLPFVNAMLNECMRWRTIMHGGFPHAATEDFDYQGYRIPKGAVLLPQVWAIDQDESIYEDPETFLPERWLSDSAPSNGPIATWGFGRRICPGRHIAKNNMFLIVARLMWAFDIKPALDEKGRRIEVDPDAIDGGFNTKPLPFRARFELRRAVAEVIEREWVRADRDIVKILNEAERQRRVE